MRFVNCLVGLKCISEALFGTKEAVNYKLVPFAEFSLFAVMNVAGGWNQSSTWLPTIIATEVSLTLTEVCL